MTENSYPYVLQSTMLVTARTLIYAPTMAAAAEILEERELEMMKVMIAAAHLPDPDDETLPQEVRDSSRYQVWDSDVRPAEGFEVAGTSKLPPGLTLLDTCEDESCEHVTSPTDAPSFPDHITHAFETLYDPDDDGEVEL